VVTGHRDTQFRFLKDLAPGDELRLVGPDGASHRYVVMAGDGGQAVPAPRPDGPAGQPLAGAPDRFIWSATLANSEFRK
jgi:hypothetical protein